MNYEQIPIQKEYINVSKKVKVEIEDHSGNTSILKTHARYLLPVLAKAIIRDGRNVINVYDGSAVYSVKHEQNNIPENCLDTEFFRLVF